MHVPSKIRRVSQHPPCPCLTFCHPVLRELGDVPMSKSSNSMGDFPASHLWLPKGTEKRFGEIAIIIEWFTIHTESYWFSLRFIGDAQFCRSDSMGIWWPVPRPDTPQLSLSTVPQRLRCTERHLIFRRLLLHGQILFEWLINRLV